MLSNSLIELDRAHLVHPVSSFRGHEKLGVRVLKSASGATVTDITGHQLIDGFAGLWCVNAGYGHDSIVEAAARQMRELPYATAYFDIGSEPAIRLASELADRAPGDLNHVYFTLGGSDAVDSTIRFIRYYWHARGEPQRDQFISIEQGYHGSTTAGFGVPYDWQHKIPSHYAYRNPAGNDPAAIIASSLQILKDKIETIGPERVAAFYAEPIQGSGGVLVPPPGWIKAMRDLCKSYGILFVADEVITGFGRTGSMFGSQHYGIEPDLITVAKGLTSAYFPLSGAIVGEKVYKVMEDGADRVGAFSHGYTYSGHPIGAAAANAVLDIVEKEDLPGNARAVGNYFQEQLKARFAQLPIVGEVRGVGLMGAIEFVADREKKTRFAPGLAVGARVSKAARNGGLIARAMPHGDILGFAPPLVTTKAEVDEIIAIAEAAVRSVMDDLVQAGEKI